MYAQQQPRLRPPYHVNYCMTCKRVYINHRFKSEAALQLMGRLGVGFDNKWLVLFRQGLGADGVKAVWQ